MPPDQEEAAVFVWTYLLWCLLARRKRGLFPPLKHTLGLVISNDDRVYRGVSGVGEGMHGMHGGG